MKRALLPAALIAALLLGAVLSQRPGPAPLSTIQIFALGTLVSITVAEDLGDTALVELEGRLRRRLEAFDTRWSVLREGDLGQLNAALAAQPEAAVPAALRADLRRASDWCQASDGRFDPAIGGWVRLWGFEDETRMRSTPPTAAEIAAARAPSWCAAQWSAAGERVRLPAAGARLNAGGFAKGQAVAELAAELRAAGVANGIVNAGGDLVVLGRHPQRAWTIGVRDPREPGRETAVATLTLADGEALFSSGDYERYFEHAGQRYHHLLDPATGRPARRAISATVLDADPVLADAGATALFVAGPDEAAAVAAALGIEAWMLIDSQGERHASPAIEARLRWRDAPG